MTSFTYRKLADHKRVRVIVLQNGKSTEPIEIVADLSNIEDVSFNLVFSYYVLLSNLLSHSPDFNDLEETGFWKRRKCW